MKWATVAKPFTVLLRLINSKWYCLRSRREIPQSYINCAERMLEVSYSLFLLSFSLFNLKRIFIYSLSQKTFLKHPLEVFSEVFNNLTFTYIWETKKILKNPPNRNRFPKTITNLWFWIVAHLQNPAGYFKNLHMSFYNAHNLIIWAHI